MSEEELESIESLRKHSNSIHGILSMREGQIILNLIEKQQKEIEKHKNTIARYEMESKSFRAFCRKIRKTEKRNVDEFNQGREYSYIQFLNLINGEQNWEHEGKYFDEVDEELEKWVERK